MAASLSPRCRQITEFLASRGEPAWRVKQVIHGIYKSHAAKWHSISGLPTGLQYHLKQRFGKFCLNWKPVSMSEGDFAQKALLESHRDQSRIEAVSLKFQTHRSLCISSQVGCAFQCSFCATGKVGLKRQLDADDIADQVMYFMQRGQKIDSVSLMGMGEPLANPKVFDALKVLTDPELVGLSRRRINVSTVGVVPGILRLTEELPQVNLAFSLHSPFPEERSKIVPLNRMYPMSQVFDVLDRRIQKTGRRVWIGYLMLRGENDSQDHARALVQLIKARPVESRYLYHVNLLPYNIARSVGDSFARASAESIESFQQTLQQNGISSSFRNSFGSGIDAACGQLFAGYESKGVSSKSMAPAPLVRPTSSALSTGVSSKSMAPAPLVSLTSSALSTGVSIKSMAPAPLVSLTSSALST